MQIHSAKGDFLGVLHCISVEIWNATWSHSNITLLWPVRWFSL